MMEFCMCFEFADSWKRETIKAKDAAHAEEIAKKIVRSNSSIYDWSFYDQYFFPNLRVIERRGFYHPIK